ncbi:unnamed protein product [Auanema sp. JU1783]|nr:unnamed protein product [Auanema sp. JU1783]
MALNGSPNVSWADLWDRTDAVTGHTQKGIEFLERIGTFAKERAIIEEEYATKLRQLAKKSLGKKKEDEESVKSFTYVRSFANMLKEIESLAGQHEIVAEKLRDSVLPFVSGKANQHKANRKACLTDLQTIHNNLNNAVDMMFKSQRSYGKSFKEAEAAYAKYCKAEKNMEISRLDLEKAKSNAHMRNQMSEDAKQNYAHAMQNANNALQNHYNQFLPDTLDRLKTVDMERIQDTKSALQQCISAEADVMSIISRCHEDMRKSVDQIDRDKDTATVIEQFKTGYIHPAPYQFEDLGPTDGCINSAGEIDSTLKRNMLSGGKKEVKVNRKQSMHQKIFGGGDKTKADANGDYGQLPPQQRIRRLQTKISELEKEKEKNQQSRDGLVKLQQVYRDNPKLGNHADCDAQLSDFGKEINNLSQQIEKFRILLDDAQSQNNLPIGGAETPPSARSGSSASSFAPPRPPQPGNRASMSEESVTSSDGISHTSQKMEKREDTYEECDMPVLGTAVAQFAYDGGTEGTMKILENDELLLIEKDEGDGWTRVRKLDGRQEGFVPTSYLKCMWYPL